MRADLFLQQCEGLRSPLRSLWTAHQVLRSCQGVRSVQNIQCQDEHAGKQLRGFGIKLQVDLLWSNIFRYLKQSQSGRSRAPLSFERVNIILNLESYKETFWCVLTCQREIWLHCVAGGCFCVWQSWIGSAFVDTWDKWAAWPDTPLWLPCSYIITGKYC